MSSNRTSAAATPGPIREAISSHSRLSAAVRPSAISASNVVMPGNSALRSRNHSTAPTKIAFGPSPVIHA
ncbi:hypothetical protein AB0H00_11150 [Nocardia sp. NPDC023852]|uniref:hypothetical protein n=1 Tax=Nocardia sp. NPDC023852 TaxID=3154697 RepID=UPI0033C6C197